MRIKIEGTHTSEDLKQHLCSCVDLLSQYGTEKISGANLYLTMRDAEGEELVLQTQTGGEGMIVYKVEKPKKVAKIKESEVVKDFTKAREKRSKANP